jgi:ABC-type branched-subunit amino acid transport system substrate-binding protein
MRKLSLMTVVRYKGLAQQQIRHILTHLSNWLKRLLPGLVSGLLLSIGIPARAATEPWVIGQSLPLTGAGFPVANRVQAGAQAQVARVNASGGILGRKIELVTLDDGGDPKRVATNMRTLVHQHHAVMLVNCLGDRACVAAAHATRELSVPLIGPMSGALALRSADLKHVFSLRADDEKQATALMQQLQAIGISKVALWVDDAEAMRTGVLSAALQRAGLQVNTSTVDARPATLEVAFRELGQKGAQALILNLGPEVLDTLDHLPDSVRATVPSTVATLSSTGLTQLTHLFRDRMIGYASVVPNPESAHLPIVRELSRDADAYIGPEAVSFEGLESYLSLRLCTEILRRAGTSADGKRLGETIENLGALDLGGFRLLFSRDRHHGSNFVEIGMRSRDGRLLR